MRGREIFVDVLQCLIGREKFINTYGLWYLWLGDNCQILAVRSDNCRCRQLSDRTTVSADNCQWGQLSVRTTVSGTTVSGPWTTVRGNCQCSEKTVRSYSCPHWVQLLFISGSSSPGAVFFSYWIWARGQRLVEWG